MMIYIIGAFACGILAGMSFILFVIGATKNEKEQEIYKKGFNDGYQSRWGMEGGNHGEP